MKKISFINMHKRGGALVLPKSFVTLTLCTFSNVLTYNFNSSTITLIMSVQYLTNFKGTTYISWKNSMDFFTEQYRVRVLMVHCNTKNKCSHHHTTAWDQQDIKLAGWDRMQGSAMYGVALTIKACWSLSVRRSVRTTLQYSSNVRLKEYLDKSCAGVKQ